jgi:hypothetical protein
MPVNINRAFEEHVSEAVARRLMRGKIETDSILCIYFIVHACMVDICCNVKNGAIHENPSVSSYYFSSY